MTRTIAFREIVLKVHSRCDLACDHCYVYEHADQSWRARPKVISPQVISQTASRLAEHARDHALPSVTVILHGGEPLLAGPDRLRLVCEEFTRALSGAAELDLRIHTNGLQLSRRYLDLFAEYGVRVGVSLDGDRAANDRHRRFADGRTSHPLVLAALELLRSAPYRHLYQGLLCTVDVANDPVAVLDALVALEPPRVDFLLPHATWQTPPERPGGAPDAYARWLLRVFDRWERLERPVPVRLFESLESTLRGGPSLTESLGLAPTDLVVVETDGTLEQVDSLKSAFEGAAATGFDVFRHAFDEVAAHPGVRALLHATGEGYAVVRAGRTEHRFGPAAGDARWLPVRTWSPGPGEPEVALEDLDPYRNCFARPPRLRLGAGEAEEWRGRLGAARALLLRTVPGFARAAVAGLGTLTPLAGGPRAGGWGEAGRHGPGALGVPYAAGVRETALALLTGRRRARLRELTEVADLYALDGAWQHPSPWRTRPVPVSRLLADVHERVAVEAYRRATGTQEPGGSDRIHRALDRLAGAAELTVSGKRLVEELRWEVKAVDA
ncbi:FxsB family radical SAM/SPASM domain protein [Streptomyces sp. WAC07061]|uniref:radical SAM/SPASM protein FxsBH, inactivated beta-hydroxylase extension form n=1 Tax=Streptomyces sp. WAC07061 TaxID=2487410 RepID=UPI000F7667B7|nr:radical SAM/SPASM protein FxsB, inactivated metallohydrolase extension form [Streptomyces sp. WAC07061]RSS50680.1 FxsB family radical SAM/SPASM domain protein [Streptomyces sp. WAC07061]